MSMLTKPSGAFPTSLIYITVGTLVAVWMGVSMYFYYPESDLGRFLLIGTLASAIAVLIIGLLLGQIGRAARNAELPPEEVTQAVASTNETAAANPPAIAPAASPHAHHPSANGHVPVATNEDRISR
jgi:cytoskeletal protein RodZ